MHEHITSNQHNLTQKFHKNLKNHKKISKTQNLSLKMHEKERIKNTYQVIEAWSWPKKEWVKWFEWGREDLSERVCFLSREVKKWSLNRACPLNIKCCSMDWRCYKRSIKH